MRNRFKRRKKKSNSFFYLIPNIFTICGMCVGFTAIHLATCGKFGKALFFIYVAALIDGFDGKIARKLSVTSRFGAELDSFSDLLTFGVTPALIIYFKELNKFNNFGWAISLIYVVCMALRLARFNTNDIQGKNPEHMIGFSTGVPAPAGAYLALMPIVIDSAIKNSFQNLLKLSPKFYAVNIFAVSILLVSALPTFLLKKGKIENKKMIKILFVVIIILCGLYSFTYETLTICGLIYISSIPLSIIMVSKRKKILKENEENLFK